MDQGCGSQGMWVQSGWAGVVTNGTFPGFKNYYEFKTDTGYYEKFFSQSAPPPSGSYQILKIDNYFYVSVPGLPLTALPATYFDGGFFRMAYYGAEIANYQGDLIPSPCSFSSITLTSWTGTTYNAPLQSSFTDAPGTLGPKNGNSFAIYRP
jgi:hypothetical protein